MECRRKSGSFLQFKQVIFAEYLHQLAASDTITTTRQHWIQHITFTAVTNAADTHAHVTALRTLSDTIPSPLATC